MRGFWCFELSLRDEEDLMGEGGSNPGRWASGLVPKGA